MSGTSSSTSSSVGSVDLASESVAGEEDPGASIELAAEIESLRTVKPDGPPPAKPDQPCATCGAQGQLNGGACPDCDGTGQFIPGR